MIVKPFARPDAWREQRAPTCGRCASPVLHRDLDGGSSRRRVLRRPLERPVAGDQALDASSPQGVRVPACSAPRCRCREPTGAARRASASVADGLRIEHRHRVRLRRVPEAGRRRRKRRARRRRPSRNRDRRSSRPRWRRNIRRRDCGRRRCAMRLSAIQLLLCMRRLMRLKLVAASPMKRGLAGARGEGIEQCARRCSGARRAPRSRRSWRAHPCRRAAVVRARRDRRPRALRARGRPVSIRMPDVGLHVDAAFSGFRRTPAQRKSLAAVADQAEARASGLRGFRRCCQRIQPRVAAGGRGDVGRQVRARFELGTGREEGRGEDCENRALHGVQATVRSRPRTRLPQTGGSGDTPGAPGSNAPATQLVYAEIEQVVRKPPC